MVKPLDIKKAIADKITKAVTDTIGGVSNYLTGKRTRAEAEKAFKQGVMGLKKDDGSSFMTRKDRDQLEQQALQTESKANTQALNDQTVANRDADNIFNKSVQTKRQTLATEQKNLKDAQAARRAYLTPKDGDIIKSFKLKNGKLENEGGNEYYIYREADPAIGRKAGYEQLQDQQVQQLINSNPNLEIKIAQDNGSGNFKILDPSNSNDKIYLDHFIKHNPNDQFLTGAATRYRDKFDAFDKDIKTYQSNVSQARNAVANINTSTEKQTQIASKRQNNDAYKTALKTNHDTYQKAIKDLDDQFTADQALRNEKIKPLEEARNKAVIQSYIDPIKHDTALAAGIGSAGVGIAAYNGADPFGVADNWGAVEQPEYTRGTREQVDAARTAKAIEEQKAQEAYYNQLVSSGAIKPDEPIAIQNMRNGIEPERVQALQKIQDATAQLAQDNVPVQVEGGEPEAAIASRGNDSNVEYSPEVLALLQMLQENSDKEDAARALADYTYNNYRGNKDLNRLGWRAFLKQLYDTQLMNKGYDINQYRIRG